MKKHRKWWSFLFVLMFVLSLFPMKGVVAEESSKQWCVSTTSSKTIFAGQNIPIGTVDFEFVADGLKIVIDLNDGVVLKNAAENIKIDFRLTSESLARGTPGQYDYKTYSNSDPTHLLISYAKLAEYLGVSESTLKSDGFQFNVFLHLDTIVNGKDQTAYAGDPGTGNPWVRYVKLTVKECTPPPPPGGDLDVYTIGFWKNLQNYSKVTFNFGTEVFVLGEKYNVTNSVDQVSLAKLMDPAQPMTEEKRLVMQLTAAKINALLNGPDALKLMLVYKSDGSAVGMSLGTVFMNAEQAIANQDINQMKYYQKILDNFNNGLFVGTSHD